MPLLPVISPLQGTGKKRRQPLRSETTLMCFSFPTHHLGNACAATWLFHMSHALCSRFFLMRRQVVGCMHRPVPGETSHQMLWLSQMAVVFQSDPPVKLPITTMTNQKILERYLAWDQSSHATNYSASQGCGYQDLIPTPDYARDIK